VRALHESELQAAGAARAVALQEADQQLDRIARLLPDALAGGLTLSGVSQITGVSRPTLYQLRGRYSDSVGDVRFALLQTIAIRQPVLISDLCTQLARPESEVWKIAQEFVTDGSIELDIPHEGDEPAFLLLAHGYETLETWEFAEDEAEIEAQLEAEKDERQ
jgi:hypothetical protein